MRFLPVAVAIALLVPAAAAAHVSIQPGLLETGRETSLLVELPQLRPGPPPVGVEVSGAGVETRSSRFRGRFGEETRWEVRVHVAAAPGPTGLVLRAAFADGSEVEIRRTVTVVPARPDEDGLPVAVAAFAALGLAGIVAAAVFLRRQSRPG